MNKSICELKLNEKDFNKSMMDLPNNKTPGSDGISIEFYKYFWEDVKPFLVSSYN